MSSFNRFGPVQADDGGLGILTTPKTAGTDSTVQVFIGREGDIFLQLGGNYVAENGETTPDPNPDPNGACYVGMSIGDALGLIEALARTITKARTESPL